MWGPSKFAVVDEKGARLEPCVYLFQKPEKDQK